MSEEIVIATGPCAVEGEKLLWDQAYNTNLVKDIAKPYGIKIYFRGGAWKPRTNYWDKNNREKTKVFEGFGEVGLRWLSEVGNHYDIPIVSECMSEMDLRHFGRYLTPERDYIQVGARTTQAYAMLYEVGGTSFGVVLKSAQQGIDVTEASGSLERFLKNREKVYCIREQKRFIHPSGIDTPEHKAYMERLLKQPNQHPHARNLNNIETITNLRKISFFSENNIQFCYDPSHAFGGNTDETRRKIGESAIQAVKEFDYDWIMFEVNDKSGSAKCDAAQALFTTLNGIDWSQTYVGKEPPQDKKPLTLVDIVKELMINRIARGFVKVEQQQITKDSAQLDSIRWDMAA